MPVILPEANRDAWIDPDHRDPESLHALLRAYPPGEMEKIPVSRHVNSPANDDPRCIEPAPAPDETDPGPPRLFR
jgi:putative SOS response-associated peptidase YedK